MGIGEKQRELTDKLLFEYYLISSVREDEIFSPFSFYRDNRVLQQMVHAAGVLDNLVRRLIGKQIGHPGEELFEMDSFPMQDEVLKLTKPLMPLFWARYDAFLREDGGIFFSEFNYDKPCAQREIAASDMMKPQNNPNANFALSFANSLDQMWKEYGVSGEKPVIAILIDPCHYEELHLAYLFCDFLKPLGYETIIAGGKNLQVENDYVKAFGHKVDIILRQFPTEFCHEVDDFGGMLELFERGRVLLVNDPRAIIGQAKSLFAYLWSLVEERSSSITTEEDEVIRNTIPYTRIFNENLLDDLKHNKDKYVIKAVYGRFSEEVYIGRMHTGEEWDETLEYVRHCGKKHIVQKFCPIKKELVPRFDGQKFVEAEAFGNFGIYMTNGRFIGTCVRWSEDYLSSDDGVWISPVGVRDKSLLMQYYQGIHRKKLWTEIYDDAAFNWGYTGGYSADRETFSLDALILDADTFKELKSASEQITEIFKKTTKFVQENYRLFCPVLGISESLEGLITQGLTDSLTFISRFDWAIDTKGDLKLLEFNSETPAGLMESMVLSKLIRDKTGIKADCPNEALGQLIRQSFLKIVGDYGKRQEIKNIGIVSSAYYEDWYNTSIVYEQLKDLSYNFIVGEVSGLEVRADKLFLYGQPLDAVYRYYPLDWFDTDPYYAGVIGALGGGTLSINPPSTLLSQSKAFLALVWELLKQNFYVKSEAAVIARYISETVLDAAQIDTLDYCSKPFFEREGHGVDFSIYGEEAGANSSTRVFQKRVDMQGIEANIYTTHAKIKEIAYPVIGTYMCGDTFAGIYTRAGGKITNNKAVYLPVYIG